MNWGQACSALVHVSQKQTNLKQKKSKHILPAALSPAAVSHRRGVNNHGQPRARNAREHPATAANMLCRMWRTVRATNARGNSFAPMLLTTIATTRTAWRPRLPWVYFARAFTLLTCACYAVLTPLSPHPVTVLAAATEQAWSAGVLCGQEESEGSGSSAEAAYDEEGPWPMELWNGWARVQFVLYLFLQK